MFFKQKRELIPFHEFLGGHTEKKAPLKNNNTTLYSLIPGFSFDFFDMSPQMTGLYTVVLSVGAFCILSNVIEMTSAKKGLHNIATSIETFTRISLPIGTFAFAIWALLKLV